MHILGARRRQARLRIGPLRRGYRAAAVVIAATGAADGELLRVCDRGVVAVMCFANAASMRRSRRGRQRERNEHSDKREQQQESGGQALHFVRVKKNPE